MIEIKGWNLANSFIGKFRRRAFAKNRHSHCIPVNQLTGDASWQDARAKSQGYDSQVILDRALASALAVKRGEAAYERDTVLFQTPAYRWQLLACVAAVAAAKRGRIHIMDVGGSLASVYLQHRKFFEPIPQLRWSIVEQPHFVSAGRSYLQGGQLSFFDSIDEVEAVAPIDVTLFLSSLQYMPDPQAVLRRVAKTNTSHLVVDRIPLSSGDADEVVIQHVPDEIYAASYPQWRLSEVKLIHFVVQEMGFSEVVRYNDGIDGHDHLGLLFDRLVT